MLYNKSMKFERPRGSQQTSDKYDLNNQEFLTFRNNPITENSGRTVYSQQFDYKSLDRYQNLVDSSNPSYNFRKKIKGLRSQDKYKQLKEDAMLFPATEENSESQTVNLKNSKEDIKIRKRKVKNMVKAEKKREKELDEEISKLQNELKELEGQNDIQREDVEDLLHILMDNEENIGLMNRKLLEQQNKKEELEQFLNSITEFIEKQVKVIRSNEDRDLQRKLEGGITELGMMIQNAETRIELLEDEIEGFKERADCLRALDSEFKTLLSK